MDPRLHEASSSSNGFESKDQSVAENRDQELVNGHSFQEKSIEGAHLLQNRLSPNRAVEDNNNDDECEFSEGVLRYIDAMLMAEEMENKTHTLQESLELEAKERAFYEVLGQKYPPSPVRDRNYHKSRTSTDYLVSKDESIIKISNTKDVDHTKSNVPTEEFDDVWIHTLGEAEKELAAYIEGLQISETKSTKQSVAKEQNTRIKGAIDLTSLLIKCAKSIAAGVCGSAKESLRQIREHSSPFGDGDQRLAHYFADGLEARLAGTGSQMHKAIVNKATTASDHMRAYCLSILTSPFRKVLNFASNNMIMTKSDKAMKIHIIDFGIFYNFQWPTFIHRMAEREGGPPKLRITGIDFPQPGSRIEDLGLRLAHYAKMFNVPFEYNAIAQRWETINIEDLKIEKGEFVVVNCSYSSMNLVDETDGAESSRNMVLKLIRKINPDIFIHGIVNGAYGDPFFLSRFREALSYFSTLFDMVETIIPKEKPERVLLERDFFGWQAMNVIACEGRERVERPEAYKQWHVRHLRAGFILIPFEKKLVDTVMYKVRKSCHRDFIVEDSKWLLLSWKGRILYALSCWQPV